MNFGTNEFESVTPLPVKLSPIVPAFLCTLKHTKTNNKNENEIIQNFTFSVLLNLLHSQVS